MMPSLLLVFFVVYSWILLQGALWHLTNRLDLETAACISLKTQSDLKGVKQTITLDTRLNILHSSIGSL